jgi:hypothetical protein
MTANTTKGTNPSGGSVDREEWPQHSIGLNHGWRVGRKAIITFLKPYLGLSDNQRTAWKMIRRWRKNLGFDVLIRYQPNGKPYLDPLEFELWWGKYEELLRKAEKVKR